MAPVKRERMVEFIRELGLDSSRTTDVWIDPDGWVARQFLLDEDGKKVLSDDGLVQYPPVSGTWD